jgi:nucleoside-diphosphate-sugar epimerase
MEFDLLNVNVVQEMTAVAPAVIVHCAAQIPIGAISDQDAAQINRKIDQNILNVAQRSGAKVVFISSSAIYEDVVLPWEESLPVSPRSMYAKEKLSSESYFSGLTKPGISLRITSPYGGFENAGRNVLYKFVHAAISNQQLPLYGSGKRCQNFIFAGDIADAVALVILEIKKCSSIAGIFNIASDSSINMMDLATIIVQLVGKGEIVYSSSVDADDHFKSEIDIGKARQMLGWAPSTKLMNGIQSLIDTMEV